jgi:hypothetical protein
LIKSAKLAGLELRVCVGEAAPWAIRNAGNVTRTRDLAAEPSEMNVTSGVP